MQKITVYNTKYKSVSLETVTEVNEATIIKILGTKNVDRYILSNGATLITPKANNSSIIGLCHSLFPTKIIYNNAFVFHETNLSYVDSYGNVRWYEDKNIKEQEVKRLTQFL